MYARTSKGALCTHPRYIAVTETRMHVPTFLPAVLSLRILAWWSGQERQEDRRVDIVPRKTIKSTWLARERVESHVVQVLGRAQKIR